MYYTYNCVVTIPALSVCLFLSMERLLVTLTNCLPNVAHAIDMQVCNVNLVLVEV